MSEVGCFWLGVGFAAGMWFLGSGIGHLGEKLEDCVIRVLDHWERDDDDE